MGLFAWIQGIVGLRGLSGQQVEVDTLNKLQVNNTGLLYNSNNAITTNTVLAANKNYFTDSTIIVNSGITLTIPNTTTLTLR